MGIPGLKGTSHMVIHGLRAALTWPSMALRQLESYKRPPAESPQLIPLESEPLWGLRGPQGLVPSPALVPVPVPVPVLVTLVLW